MKKLAPTLFLAIALASGVLPTTEGGSVGAASPEAACSLDLNADGRLDWAFVLPNQEKREFLLLLSKGSSYTIRMLDVFAGPIVVECVGATHVRGSLEGEERRRAFSTPNGYVRVDQPEGPAYVLFLRSQRLVKVWTKE